MAKHIHVFIDDEERQQELIAIRHIERTLKPLQERVRKFKEWAETQAELAAKGDIPGTVVTLELGQPDLQIRATGSSRKGFDRKRLLSEHPEYADTYMTETTFWRKQL